MPEQKLANPAPLGLLGFGVTTVLLNLHNAGLFSLDSMILSMGIFYGGIAQIIAGILEFKKGNTFGVTAFTSYGLFWFSLVFLLLFPKIGLGDSPSNIAMATYLFMWGLFTLLMYFGASKLNAALQFVFGSLTILFFLLSLSEVTGIVWIKTIAGLEGIVCGFSAVYLAIAEVLNEINGKTILPICPKKK
jgi:succinate-acetate transporter protein